MYRYLDSSVQQLGSMDQLLLFAMRIWVKAARAGRCPCAELDALFRTQGLAAVLPDFAMAMAALDSDGIGRLAFRAPACRGVGDDEARLLSLFAVGREGPSERVERVAATLVAEEATRRLARAVDLTCMMIASAGIGARLLKSRTPQQGKGA